MSNDPRDYREPCDMCGEKVWRSEANAHDCPAVLCANTCCNRPFVPESNEITCTQCGDATEDDIIKHYMEWIINTCENPFEEVKSIYVHLPQEVKDEWIDTFIQHTCDE